MTNEHRYDGTKESSDAAWAKANGLSAEALASVQNAIRQLEEAQEVSDAEERRHRVPSAAQHTSVMWMGMVDVLEKVAECLGAEGRPDRSVSWNGEDFEVEAINLKERDEMLARVGVNPTTPMVSNIQPM